MPKIPEEEIERIKRETDLVALIRSRGIELTKHGSKDFVGLCPFHEDKATPNLIVSSAKGLWHCMACGAAGNPIQFVEKFDGVSFRHAFVLLNEGKALDSGEQHETSTVRKLECPLDLEADDETLTKQVIRYYHEQLLALDGAKARDFLAKRGLDHPDMIQKFHLGYADRTLGLRLPHKNRRAGAAIRERLTKLGFYRESGHEHLNGSLIVPIFTAAGQVGEVYGRKIARKLRIGTPDHLYLPGPHRGIFNPGAFANRELILCESLIDALTFWQHGMESVTTIFGTEGFTDELFEAIKHHQIESIRIAYDADDAGERAAERDIAKFTGIGIECHRIRFPWGEDANSFAQNVGADALKRAVRQAEWLGAGPKPKATAAAVSSLAASQSLVAESAPEPVETAAKNGNSATPALVSVGEHHELTIGDRRYRVGGLFKNGGLDSLKITLRLWHGERFHLDQADLCKDADRRRFCERAAHECRLEPELVKRDLGKLLLACEHAQDARLRAETEPSEAIPVSIPANEQSEALELLRDPKLITKLAEHFDSAGIVGEQTNKLAAYLAATSRLLDKPLAVIIQSTSAAGKTTLMEAVLSFFPPEEQVKYSAMTGQSLYYLGEGNLKHKILAIVEEEGAEKASYALKLLQSEGELTIASTGKDGNTGRMKTEEYHVEGPVAILLTTTSIDIDEELMNRCLILTVDESKAQTERIHALQRSARTLQGLKLKKRRAKILTLLQNAQRMLKPLDVINPFAVELTFTAERTRTRRDHEKYLTLIESVTLLHQFQRPLESDPDAGSFIRTTLEDIEIANQLAPEVLGRSLDELPPQTRRLLEELKKMVAETCQKRAIDQDRCHFTRREVRERTGWTEFQVRTHLGKLDQMEFVIRRQGKQGFGYVYELAIDCAQPDQIYHVGLLGLDKLRQNPPV